MQLLYNIWKRTLRSECHILYIAVILQQLFLSALYRKDL